MHFAFIFSQCSRLLFPKRLWKWASTIPTKHLLVLKTSSTRLQRNNFMSSKTSWRRLEDVLKISCKTSWRRLEDVFKTSWETKSCYAEDVLKTSWRNVLKKSWRHVLKLYWRHILRTSLRHYGDKQKSYWGYLYLTNLNVYLTSLYLTNLINQNPIISLFLLFWNSSSISILRIKISDDWFRDCRKGETIKTNF